MNSNESILQYVNGVSVIETKLSGVGHNLTDSDKQRVLLRWLRKEFRNTADLILAMDKSLQDPMLY